VLDFGLVGLTPGLGSRVGAGLGLGFRLAGLAGLVGQLLIRVGNRVTVGLAPGYGNRVRMGKAGLHLG
jgi:hypothetical protein